MMHDTPIQPNLYCVILLGVDVKVKRIIIYFDSFNIQWRRKINTIKPSKTKQQI